MDAVGAGFGGGLEDGVGVQVGGGDLCRANADGFVGLFNVQGVGVGFGVDGNGSIAQRLGCADDPDGDFASVSDE